MCPGLPVLADVGAALQNSQASRSSSLLHKEEAQQGQPRWEMQDPGSPSHPALLLPAAPCHQETGSAPQELSRARPGVGNLAQAACTWHGCQLSLALGERLLAFPQRARHQHAGTQPHGTRQDTVLPCTGHFLFPKPAAPTMLQGGNASWLTRPICLCELTQG